MYDHGGGCACGLKRYCDCGTGQADGSGMPKPKKYEEIYGGTIVGEVKNSKDTYGVYISPKDSYLSEQLIKWTARATEEIIKSGGNPSSVLGQIPTEFVETLARNNIYLTYEKP